ncbi:hypothetical protein K493DRAFT_26295 [Basidiobolus meristosporus CBS 931.73]|uniref:Uncharacterized protein n=1 Tax=Basidiobolus meristosporus CBS 931.73 TaxID=1314790 RepID=A0A1Y1YBB1_9FUNG|nr:hypothetical protein K493DRAFT_26295 [Basidiobolus meristosporus CBS 931.73]|eukprot:ORX95195.1 hypothetical protein K493DRAFT_26295 [Basidiobolus meristosporus CBS 931.73]
MLRHKERHLSVSTRPMKCCLWRFERRIISLACHFGMALAPYDVISGGNFQTKGATDERRKRGWWLTSVILAQ